MILVSKSNPYVRNRERWRLDTQRVIKLLHYDTVSAVTIPFAPDAKQATVGQLQFTQHSLPESKKTDWAILHSSFQFFNGHRSRDPPVIGPVLCIHRRK